MAFGFGFNKQKVLSAAEKFVQQGKLQNAIAEYEKVLKADPKDLTVMNTVGDLYSRLGNIDKAVDCFKSVGDAYASQGFTVKAIAMYKKLSKLKHSFEGVLRLAELYTQQGLFNDARAQYLQVAEEFLRSGELEQAVRIFQKTLEMDPDNVVMRSKLAEVYVRLGKKTEAWQIFSAAVETLRSRGQLEGAETLLQRMLTLDPGNSYALLLRGRTALDAGDTVAAIDYLEKVADLDSHPEGLSALFKAYLQNGRLSDARVLAGKLLSVHNAAGPISSCAETLMASGQFEEALQLYQEYSDSLLAVDPTKVLDSLHSIISHVRDNPASLETILALFTKAGENSHMTEVYELLAHAYVQSGDLEKARDYYQRLTQLEPQNQLHARNFQQISEKLGGSATRFISSEEGSILIEELETTAPFIDQRYDDDVALRVRAALTDAELFISYNMPEKAITPLLTVLPQAPQDLRLNQRLAALHNRAERFSEAAVCCRTLESVYHDAGYPDEATRYGELAARYEERALLSEGAVHSQAEAVADVAPFVSSGEEVAASEAEIPVVHSSEAPVRGGMFFHVPTAIAGGHDAEFQVAPMETHAQSEIDLSNEWDGSSDIEVSPVPVQDDMASAEATPMASAADFSANVPAEPPAENLHSTDEATVAAESTEEIRFYLANSMIDLAYAAFTKLEQYNPSLEILPQLRDEIALAAKTATAQDEVSVEIPLDETSAEPAAVTEPEIAVEAPAMNTEVENLDSYPESSLGTEFAIAPVDTDIPDQEVSEPIHSIESEPQTATFAHASNEIEAVAMQSEATSQPQAIESHGEVSDQTAVPDALANIVSDLEASLGDGFVPAQSAAAPALSEAERHAGTPTMPEIAASAHDTIVPATPLASAHVASAAMAAAAPGSSSVPSPVMPRHQSTAFTTFTKPPAPVQPPPMPEAPVPSLAASAGIDLADMFGELKHELEADAAANMDEDPETHYSLGVAFREMGLLDEAIGELQKVCQTVEHGHPFAQILQTYTWLAQCFLDKGIPEAALRWYERALTLPSLNQETRTALHYELACACESAGDRPTALHHFMEVYGSNIDYRDVSERIKALRS